MDIEVKKLAVIFAVALMLSGCAGIKGTSSIGEITLKPGDASVCYDAPCGTYFLMPPGEGTFLVKEDGPAGTWETGTFKAGEKTFAGSYWLGLTVFTIEGPDGKLSSSSLTVLEGGP